MLNSVFVHKAIYVNKGEDADGTDAAYIDSEDFDSRLGKDYCSMHYIRYEN